MAVLQRDRLIAHPSVLGTELRTWTAQWIRPRAGPHTLPVRETAAMDKSISLNLQLRYCSARRHRKVNSSNDCGRSPEKPPRVVPVLPDRRFHLCARSFHPAVASLQRERHNLQKVRASYRFEGEW